MIIILITRYELGESRCITVIELRTAQLWSNWSFYATIVARKASFTPRNGERAVSGEKKTANGARAEKLRPSAYRRRVGPSRKTLIIVKFYERLSQKAVLAGEQGMPFLSVFPPSFPVSHISLFFFAHFPARESQVVVVSRRLPLLR